MRCLLLLSCVGLVAAGPTLAEKGQCIVNSGEAVSDAMDASLFVWAAAKRCGKVGQNVKCEIDVASATKSVNSMINVILRAVDECDGLHTANKACGMKASQFTEHSSGLAAAVGALEQKCPFTGAAAVGMGAAAAPVMCTVDIKNTAKQLFKATNAFQKTGAKCKDNGSKACAVNALDIVSSLSGMGAWLSGSVGQCSRTTNVTKVDSRAVLCAEASGHLLQHTANVAADGVELSELCKPPAAVLQAAPDTMVIEEEEPRLYEEGSKKDDSGISAMNLVLGAFLPVTAIVSFVGGRFYSSRRAQAVQTRDFLSDHE